MSNSLKLPNSEIIKNEVLATTEVQASFETNLKEIKERLTDPTFIAELESLFNSTDQEDTHKFADLLSIKTSFTEKLDCLKNISSKEAKILSDNKLKRVSAVSYLLYGKRLSEKEIRSTAVLAKEFPLMGTNEAKYLTPDIIIAINIAAQLLLSPSAIMGVGASIGFGVDFIPALIGSGAFYGAMSHVSHEDDTKILIQEEDQTKQIKKRKSVGKIFTSFSIAVSVFGGIYIPAIIPGAEKTIQQDMIKQENLDRSLSKVEEMIAKSNPNYRTLIEEKQKINDQIENEAKDLIRIQSLTNRTSQDEQLRSNYLSHTSNPNVAVYFPRMLKNVNDKIISLEKNSLKSNTDLVLKDSIQVRKELQYINSHKGNAWNKNVKGEFEHIDALKRLAIDQGIGAEDIPDLAKGKLSPEMRNAIAAKTFDSKNLPVLIFTLGLLGLDLYSYLVRSKRLDDKKIRLLLNSDFRTGLEKIAKNYEEQIKLLVAKPVCPKPGQGKNEEEKAADDFYDTIKSILPKILSSEELAIAIEIIAKQKPSSLGFAIDKYQDMYSDENRTFDVQYQKTANEAAQEELKLTRNEQKIATFKNHLFEAYNSDSFNTLRLALIDGINSVGGKRLSPTKPVSNNFIPNILNKSNTVNNKLEESPNKYIFVQNELEPISSILDVLDLISNWGISHPLDYRIGKMLLSYHKKLDLGDSNTLNPSIIYNIDKVVEISKLPESGMTQDEITEIELILQNPNSTKESRDLERSTISNEKLEILRIESDVQTTEKIEEIKALLEIEIEAIKAIQDPVEQNRRLKELFNKAFQELKKLPKLNSAVKWIGAFIKNMQTLCNFRPLTLENSPRKLNHCLIALTDIVMKPETTTYLSATEEFRLLDDNSDQVPMQKLNKLARIELPDFEIPETIIPQLPPAQPTDANTPSLNGNIPTFPQIEDSKFSQIEISRIQGQAKIEMQKLINMLNSSSEVFTADQEIIINQIMLIDTNSSFPTEIEKFSEFSRLTKILMSEIPKSQVLNQILNFCNARYSSLLPKRN